MGRNGKSRKLPRRAWILPLICGRLQWELIETLDMQRIRDHVYEFDNLVIGGNLPALLYAYSKSLPILCIKRCLPLRFQETEAPVFSGYQKVDLWNRLSALLSLSGLMPFSNKINSLRITGENSAEVFSDSRKFSISFNKLSIFDEENIHGLEPPIFKPNSY